MKKIFVSVGLAAGAAGLASSHAQDVQTPSSPKFWNVSSSLRGFYDDNYNSSSQKQGSWGFEARPSISANVDRQQTDFAAKYTFGVYFYLERSNHGEAPFDYTHQASVWLDHAFDETLKVNVSDSFVIAQDPQLVQGGAVSRVNGNNINNHAQITVNKDWTRQFSTSTHYGNNLVIYNNNDGGTPANPSNAALLNRMEQNVGNDFQWLFQPETMGFVGYDFSWVNYTGNQQISTPQTINGKTYYYYSDSRNTQTHYGYVGVQHKFSPSLSGTVRGGVSATDIYNDPVSPSWSLAPYADLSATYTYLPGSYVQLGFTQNQSETSVYQPNSNGHLTQFQNTSTAYLDVNHRFDAKLSGSLVSQYSYSTFVDGAYSAQPENALNAGVNLTYQLNSHLSANTGYNFYELFSNVAGQAYSRNVVYLGLTASY